jgi:carbamoyltransferase
VNIVGISSHYHDSAACLLRDGVLVAAAQEERFSRRKHDPRIPLNALKYCIEEGELSIAEIDCVAFYENPAKKLERQVWSQLHQIRQGGLRELSRFDPVRPLREISEQFGYTGRVMCFDHHLSHAASAYYFSGFANAAVLTVDGVGEWATSAYGRGEGSNLSLFQGFSFPDSLGLLYSTVTSYLGFSVNDGEYKVMGLAPYGECRFIDEMRQLGQLTPGGDLELDLQFFDFSGFSRMYTERFCSLFGRNARMPESELNNFHCDVARSLQEFLEECLLSMCRHLKEQVDSRNLCLAGGVALNCVANSRILREGPFERLFVQPAAGDAGGCLGAAALSHVQLTGNSPARERLTHAFYGPGPKPGEIASLLADTDVGAQDFRGREAELLEATVDRLAEGRVIGWFQGRMEFGPRALGARSILADPRRLEMRDLINARVKQRESFRPFAPAALEDHVAEHFDLDHASPFMLETCRVTSPLVLPAITHVDGSARLQTVDVESNRRFALLLRAFYVRTGCPILLNTSFNMRGQPIVCTAVDALVCFLQSRLDSLVLEDFLIDSAAVPKSWFHWYGHVDQDADRMISTTVYTFL